MVLALAGLILVEVCASGIQKIPFTCSYLPGRSNLHLTFWICVLLLFQTVSRAAALEEGALGSRARYGAMVAALGVILAALRLRPTDGPVEFEATPPGQIQLLGIGREGLPPR